MLVNRVSSAVHASGPLQNTAMPDSRTIGQDDSSGTYVVPSAPHTDPCLPKQYPPSAASLLKQPAATSYDAVRMMYWTGTSDGPSTTSGRHRQGDRPERINSEKPLTSQSGLQAWASLHFVHTELLTAEECLSLVDYFHTNIAPFSPLISDTYREHSSHSLLIRDEPILAMTILVIASRFMIIDGVGGRFRSWEIHNTLWKHLQIMITHMIWGQEHFNGIFDSAPIVPTSSGADHYPDSAHMMCPSLGGLRTIGACEALLLLTDWNPRAIHFPRRDDHLSITASSNNRA